MKSKMPYIVVTCLVIVGLCWTNRSHGQTEPQHQIERQDADVLGGLSPDLVSNIRALAILVQKRMAEGQINDAMLQRELQRGDAGSVIRGLGPDANRLLDEIKTSLQANYSEESLAVLLQALTNSSPTSR